MPNQQYNPIMSVGGATVACPSSYQYKLSDVSAADAGRTEDAKMHNMRIAQKVHLEREWQNITTAEYIQVNYLDPKANGYVTKTFYVGDRSVPAYNTALGLWTNVAFNIIEQ